MKLLTIVFSNHCDLDCTYCCVQSKNLSPVNVDYKKIRAFIDEYIEYGSVIEFYGGEPTLHKASILYVFSYLNTVHPNKEVYTRLYTNGLFNKDSEEDVVLFAELFDEVLISLDGYTYAENRQRFNSEEEFNTVMRNISLIAANNPDVKLGISAVLFGKEKFDNVFANYQKFRALGVNYFSYEPLTIYNDNKGVVIPKPYLKSFIKDCYLILEDMILNYPNNSELFVAKELISSRWFSNGDKTRCTSMVRALSPRGNVYMCRDHAANEEEMFYSPKIVQFVSKNNLKIGEKGFPLIAEHENNMTPCPVKNIQYKDSGIDSELYWLSEDWQDLLIRPLYYSIIIVDDKRIEGYQDVLNIVSRIDQFLELVE